MRNYGFDYLVEKAQILSEMARPSTNRPEKDTRVVKFLKEIRPIVGKELFDNREYPWKVSAPIKTLNDYITEQLYTIGNKTAFPYDSVDAYVKNLFAKKPELEQDYYDYVQGGSRDSNKRSWWIMSFLLNKNPDLALSKEFFDTVTNRDNIENYKQTLSERAVGGKKNRAAGYRKHIQQKYNMSADDFAKMKGEVWPIIVRINRKSKQFLPKGMLAKLRNNESIISDSKGSSLSDEMLPLDVFIGTLTSIVEDPMVTSDYNLDVASLSQIIKILEARLSENKPVSKQKLYDAYINRFPENFKKYFQAEFEADLESYSGKNFSETIIDDQRKAIENILDVYTPDFLRMVQSKGVISEDDIDKILKWKDLIQSSDAQEKAEISARRKSSGLSGDVEIDPNDTFSDVRKGSEEFAKERIKSKKPKKEENPSAEEFSSGDDTNGLSNKEINDKIREIISQDEVTDEDYAEIRRLKSMLRQEDEEAGVMGYFSEQVRKDGLLNKVGEFKDRGFKKPKNYHHWLMIND